MAKSKLSFPTKSFSIRISRDLSEVLDNYVESLEEKAKLEKEYNELVQSYQSEHLKIQADEPKKKR